MRIKEVAEKLNVSPRAIRFYEEKGLISPLKGEDNRYRSFDDDDIWRLQTIISLREAGLGLDDIRKALPSEGEDGAGEELIRHLEIRRSEMISAWLELKQTIETADRMLSLLYNRDKTPVELMFEIAQSVKSVRELRSGWQDLWDFDRLAATHDSRVESNAGEFSEYARALDLIVSWITVLPGEKGLDLGTGTGNLAGRLIREGANMAGVDQSIAMLRRCKAKFPAMETKVGNLLAIPYTGETFDFIVSSYALQHLSDGQKPLALEEMLRVLKPRGRICIADLMLDGELEQRELADSFPSRNPLAKTEELAGFFERRGYVVKMRRIHGLLHVMYAVPLR